MIDITKKVLNYYTSKLDVPGHLALKLLPHLKFKKLKKDQILVNAGEICSTGYIIIEGGLILSHVNQYNQEEKVVSFFLPTLQPFGTATDSYFTNKMTHCKLFAFENSVVCYISKSSFEEKLKADSEMMNYYLFRLNEMLVFENNLRMKLLTFTSEQFYYFLLTEYPQIVRNVPTKYIAQFMGISREWLSKIKSKKANF
jgi:CRP-like cAMP-binding protein